MNLKAIIQKVVSWFKGGAKTIEQDAFLFIADKISGDGWELSKDGGFLIIDKPIKDLNMSTSAAATATPAVTNTNVDSAIKIALFLKALDANLTDAAVQAATTAALATAYPAVAAVAASQPAA